MIAFDNTYARLPEGFFARINPDQSPDPKLIKVNSKLATKIGLDADWLVSDAGIAMLSGAEVMDGSEPLAMAYAGHQFGHLTMLGDGRAVVLGEHITPNKKRFDIFKFCQFTF